MNITNDKFNPQESNNSFSAPHPTAKDPLTNFVTLLKLQQVVTCTAVPKSTIYRKIAEGKFPKPVRLGKKAVAWRSDEVLNWINSRERVSSDCWQENE